MLISWSLFCMHTYWACIICKNFCIITMHNPNFLTTSACLTADWWLWHVQRPGRRELLHFSWRENTSKMDSTRGELGQWHILLYMSSMVWVVLRITHHCMCVCVCMHVTYDFDGIYCCCSLTSASRHHFAYPYPNDIALLWMSLYTSNVYW